MSYRAVPWDEVPEDRMIMGIRRRIVTGEQVMLGHISLPVAASFPGPIIAGDGSWFLLPLTFPPCS